MFNSFEDFDEKSDPDGGLGDEVPIAAAEIEAACNSILASEMFANAPRMCRLLRYLIEKALSGNAQDAGEYAIGIKVFDRDPAAYSTTEDPIVRVQIGRLRERLRAYYAAAGMALDIEISIPMGSYVPSIRRLGRQDASAGHSLAVQPIKCIAWCEDGEPFTQGLCEELMHQLYKKFDGIVVTDPFRPTEFHAGSDGISRPLQPPASNHLLEGSIRIDAERIRASVRLVDISLGCIAWAGQFDRNIFFSIAQQEELAASICSELKRFLCHS